MIRRRKVRTLVAGYLLVWFQSHLIVAQETGIDFDESRFQTLVSQLEESSPVQRENATVAIVAEFGVDCVARLARIIAESDEGTNHPCVPVLDRIGDSRDTRTVALVGSIFFSLARQSVLAKKRVRQGNRNADYLRRIQQRRKGRTGLTILDEKVLQQMHRLTSLERQKWFNEMPMTLELSPHDGPKHRTIYLPDETGFKTHRIEQFTTPGSLANESMTPEQLEKQVEELLTEGESAIRVAFRSIETEMTRKLERSRQSNRKWFSGTTVWEITMDECFKLVITKEWSGDTKSLEGVALLPCLSSVIVREQFVDKPFLDCMQAWKISGPVILEDCEVDLAALAAFVEQQVVPELMRVVVARSESYIGLSVRSGSPGRRSCCGISGALPFSPAAAVGIRASDRKVIAFNGIPVNHTSTFHALRQCMTPGEEVELEIEHNDGTRSKKTLVVQTRD